MKVALRWLSHIQMTFLGRTKNKKGWLNVLQEGRGSALIRYSQQLWLLNGMQSEKVGIIALHQHSIHRFRPISMSNTAISLAMATGCLHPSQKTTSLYLIITYPDHIDTAYPNASMPPRFADRYAHVYFHAIRSIYPSAERLGVEIGSRWRAVFSILPKNQDWEWVLEILGDALSRHNTCIHL